MTFSRSLHCAKVLKCSYCAVCIIMQVAIAIVKNIIIIIVIVHVYLKTNGHVNIIIIILIMNNAMLLMNLTRLGIMHMI